jgi:hypothetical protein
MSFECEYCGNKFKSESNKINHQKTSQKCLKVQNKPVQEVECEKCSKRLATNYSLERHKKKCKKYLEEMKNNEEEKKENEEEKKENDNYDVSNDTDDNENTREQSVSSENAVVRNNNNNRETVSRSTPVEDPNTIIAMKDFHIKFYKERYENLATRFEEFKGKYEEMQELLKYFFEYKKLYESREYDVHVLKEQIKIYMENERFLIQTIQKMRNQNKTETETETRTENEHEVNDEGNKEENNVEVEN